MQVHAEAERVIRFWLDEVPADKRFAKDDALDTQIRDRFAALREAVLKDPEPWRADGRTTLAAIILLDQFSRNLFRGDARAFAADPIAIGLTRLALERGWDVAMSGEERQFLYMPFMHSEDEADQRRGVRLFEQVDNPQALDFARRHLEQIERFGRFPQRNDALGRDTTPEEAAFMAQPGATF